nr:DUF4395 domain-containing protein [Microbacterium sp. NIBRBAC000506063]
MFLLGGAAFATAFFTGSAQPLQPFGMFFMIDMLLRVTAGDRWSPTLMLGRLAVKGQRPEWVGAPQKELAWWLGFGLALVACASMGLFAAPLWIPARSAAPVSLCSSSRPRSASASAAPYRAVSASNRPSTVRATLAIRVPAPTLLRPGLRQSDTRPLNHPSPPDQNQAERATRHAPFNHYLPLRCRAPARLGSLLIRAELGWRCEPGRSR